MTNAVKAQDKRRLLPVFVKQVAEGANRATIVSCTKPRRNAAVNRGTTVFARHDLGGVSCGCLACQIGAIMRSNRIALALKLRNFCLVPLSAF